MVDPTTVAIDALDFCTLARKSPDSNLLHLWTGPFLEGFDLSPSHAFDEWRDNVASRTRAAAERAFTILLQDALQAANWTLAETIADQLLLLAPLNAQVQSHRIGAIHRMGHLDRAKRELRRVQAMFETEIGERFQGPDIQVNDGWIDGEDPAPSSPLPPFVGRRNELRRLASLWRRVEEGRGQIGIILGEAGIGKTRFATHFLRWCALRGATALVGHCTPHDQHRDYTPFTEALSAHLDDLSTEAEGRDAMMPLVGIDDGGRRSKISQLELSQCLGTYFQTVTNEKPIVLLLDDLHWADPATIQLLISLRDRVRECRLLVLGTLRPEELRSGSLSNFLEIGATNGPDSVIELGLLDSADASSLIRSIWRAEDVEFDEALVQHVLPLFGGHPFFVIEALEDLRLARADGQRFQPTAPPSIWIPSGAASLLRSRVATLSSVAATLARLFAFGGPTGDIKLMMEVAGCNRRQVVQALEELVRHRILEERGTRYAFKHDLLRQVVVVDTSMVDRQDVHWRLARHGRRHSPSAHRRIAYHLVEAGLAADAAEFEISAAVDALASSRYSEAEYLLRGAVDHSNSSVVTARAAGSLIELLIQCGRLEEAKECLRTYGSLIARHGSPRHQIICDAVRLWSSVAEAETSVHSQLRNAQVLAAAAQQLKDDDLSADVLSKLAEVAHDAGRVAFLRTFAPRLARRGRRLPRGHASATLLGLAARLSALYVSADLARRYGGEAVDIAEEVKDCPLLVKSLVAHATALMRSGRLVRARAEFERAFVAVENKEFRHLRGRVINNYAVCLFESGLDERAAALLLDGLDRCVVHDRVFRSGNLALMRLSQGRFDEALYFANELSRSNESLKASWIELVDLAIRGTVAIARGDQVSTEKILTRARHIDLPNKFAVSDYSYVAIFFARADAARGDYERAVQFLTAAEEFLVAINVPGVLRVALERWRIRAQVGLSEPHRGDLSNLAARARLCGALNIAWQADALLTASLSRRRR
ncbi:MAG: AAA family ATPase [Gemmatimonadetes bacterium]|nr:AAA family ATPase [Gemmatimonadota bacterium]